MWRRVRSAAAWTATMGAPVLPARAQDGGAGTLIAEALPPFRVGAVLCLEGSFSGKTVDVDDWYHPLRGTRPADDVNGLPSLPSQMLDRTVRRVQLRLVQVKREHDADDRLYEFKVLVDLEGAARPLVGSGECSYRSRRRVMDRSWTLEPTTTAMRCGVDCDGGGLELTRVPGTSGNDLRILETGLRTSGACFGAHYRIGVLRRDPASGEPVPDQPPVSSFPLHRVSAASCATLARRHE